MLPAYSSAANPKPAASTAAAMPYNDLESRLEKISLNLLQQSIYTNTRASSVNSGLHPLYHHHHKHHHLNGSIASSHTTHQKSLSVPNINVQSSSGSSVVLSALASNMSPASAGPAALAKNGKSKKVVRFADMLGFQLVTERIISSCPSMFYYNSSDDDENEDLNNAEYLLAGVTNPGDVPGLDAAAGLVLHNTLHLTVSTADASLPGSSSPLTASPSSFTAVVSPSGGGRSADLNQFIYDNLRFTWKCGFEQPSLAPDFYTQLRERKVCLESICTDHFILNGFVRVLNTSASKRVFMRYTLNNWSTHSDYECSYLLNSTQSAHNDRFKFSVILDKNRFFASIDEYRTSSTDSLPSLKLEFALCYEELEESSSSKSGVSSSMPSAVAVSHWDNNNGKNYHYDCFFKII
jgi:protein phosphatase 1 regulatory subunit 3A/B/C/D/E